MNILGEIVMYKRLDLARRKVDVRIEDLERTPLYNSPVFSLKNALIEGKGTGIIAEFKRKSPSKGLINDKSEVQEVTKAYTLHGASALSVLTDEKFFGGSMSDLVKARENKIPILRKDFIVDEYQLIESKSIGADIILLIAAALTPAEVKSLARFAKNLGLEVLLEIHNEKEAGHICDEVDIVGVNNRDLKTFKTNIDISLGLIGSIPADKPAITESGINTVQALVKLKKAGFKGFLIGENFMKDDDPGESFKEFVADLSQQLIV